MIASDLRLYSLIRFRSTVVVGRIKTDNHRMLLGVRPKAIPFFFVRSFALLRYGNGIQRMFLSWNPYPAGNICYLSGLEGILQVFFYPVFHFYVWKPNEAPCSGIYR